MAIRPFEGGACRGLYLVLAGAFLVWTPVHAADTDATYVPSFDSLYGNVLAFELIDLEPETLFEPAALDVVAPAVEREANVPPVENRTAQFLIRTVYQVPQPRAPPTFAPLPDW
ncbi:MAG: hypothetical protein H6948_02135 [Zoogloeaceae bacterium]|nr:hypothetical protein [Zoogloeaceae bacterium]